MEDHQENEPAEQPLKPSDKQPIQPAPEDDPINASGDYVFKRFNPEPTGTVEEPDLDDVVAALSQSEPPADAPPPAALTITVHSWATPVVGIVMLLLGIAGGYFLRPMISPEAAPVATEAAATNTQTQSSPEDREALMAAIVPNVRHFLGDPGAPITMIEFSDFQ